MGKTRVRGVVVHALSEVADLRGNLVVGEIGKFLPFEAKRFFIVHGVSSREIRGQHAHRKCHQFLVCVRGSCRVIADDGKRRRNSCSTARRAASTCRRSRGASVRHSADAALSSRVAPLRSADYLRDYDEFLRLVRRR
jgi:hypothetical protein